MSVPDAYEVFALLDHADWLAAHDRSVAGQRLLDIGAARALASDLAVGMPVRPVELPGSVEACLAAAAERVSQWDRGSLSMSAGLLVMVLAAAAAELGA